MKRKVNNLGTYVEEDDTIRQIALWMFIFGLNMRFISGCISAFRLSADNRLLVTDVLRGGAVPLIVASGALSAVHYGLSWIKYRYRTLTAVFICYLQVLVIRALFDLLPGDLEVQHLLGWLGLAAFLYPLVLFLGGDERLWKVLRPVLIAQTLIAIPIVLATMDWFSLMGNIASELNQYRPYRLLYGFPFLLISYRTNGSLARIAGVGGLTTFLFYGVSANRRGLILLSVTMFLLAIVVYHRTLNIQSANLSRSKLPASTGLVFFALLCILALIAFPVISERISIGTDVLTDRWAEENRSTDVKNFLADITFTDWIIGRAAIGTYDPGGRYAGRDVFHERLVVDVGWLSLVLKGGLILVVLVLLVPVASAVEAFFKSQENLLTLACACMVFLWLVRLIYQGFFSTLPHMILLWLCVGRCLSISGNSRSR
ncbi:MAG: hypothetical protein ACYSWZ_00315 [Planctomycetota bacterium]